MSSIADKKIFIFQQRGWAITIGHFLAKKLHQEHARLGSLTLKKTTHDFIINQKEVPYELIINNDEIMSEPKKYLGDSTYTLAEICRALGIQSIWPIVQSLRNHVRTYKDKYYYGFKQNVSDEEIIDYVKAVYKCIRTVFDDFKPDFIITPNFVALPHILFNLYAEKHDVPMLGLTDSKVKGNYIFIYDYNDEISPLHDRITELSSGTVSPNREKARHYIQEFRERFKVPDGFNRSLTTSSWYKKIRHEIAPYYHILKWYLKPQINTLKSTGITPDYRPPKIILRDHYAHKYNKKFADQFKYYPLEKIKKAVYFPLQFQPEMAVDVTAPYFNNQIETARQIAMSMPDDYTLLVKDHPAMIGYRPASYIEKVARTVNVKLVDYKIPTEKILKKVDLVISPNSTTLAEAALLSKPAIQLGNLGTTLKLPNVFKHTDMTTLAGKIKELLGLNLHTPEYEHQLENYVAAAYDVGISFDYISTWELGDTTALENLWQFYRQEIERKINTTLR